MTTILDRSEDFAATALAGFCALHPHLVRPVPGGALRATETPDGKVALVVGGGSGHFPAFAGYVGQGLADAAVAGDVFASPATQAIVNVARQANRGGGVMLGFGNYAGDVLNFGVAAERLRAEGIETCLMAVTDDVASAAHDEAHLRRGVAGDLCVFKIAGAASEAGLPLAEVERVTRQANANTVSFGVAFSGCTLPGRSEPLFTVKKGQMAVGLGIHGEPGIGEEALGSASSLAGLLVDKLLAEPRPRDAQRVAPVLNGLGRTKHEELFVLWIAIDARLRAAGLTIVEPLVGEFVTSLDMAGCSLSLLWLDQEREAFWRAPADTFVLRRGVGEARSVVGPSMAQTPVASDVRGASAEGQAAGRCVADIMDALAGRMAADEEELGRLDAIAGDGDHGQGMARGSAAAAAAAKQAALAGAGPATVLALAGDAWAERAGGTSGALWGLALRAWSTAFDDDATVAASAVACGARAALEAVVRRGGARVGDKTLVDALVPFVEALEHGVGSGQSLRQAWRSAAERAVAAAHATAGLTPRLGRARPLAAKSIGHPDAGAVSLARCATEANLTLGLKPQSSH